MLLFILTLLNLASSPAHAGLPAWVHEELGFKTPCKKNLPPVRSICEAVEASYDSLQDLHRDPRKLQIRYLLDYVILPQSEEALHSGLLPG